MARELAEIYYSSYRFGLDIKNKRGFLHDDRTDTGLKPIEHIRKRLDVLIWVTMNNGEREGAWANTDYEERFLNRIYTNLKHLLLLPHIHKIPVTIRIGTFPLTCHLRRGDDPRSYNMEGDRRFYNIMEAVREPIYDLLHADVNLEVWHVASFLDNGHIVLKGPRNYFEMSKDAWQEERQSHGSSWTPSSNFISREDCQKDTLRRLLVQRWGFVNWFLE